MSTITSTSLGNGNGAYATDIVVKDMDLTVSNYVKDRTPVTNMAMSKKRKINSTLHIWPNDYFRQPGLNAKLEGASVDSTTVNSGRRFGSLFSFAGTRSGNDADGVSVLNLATSDSNDVTSGIDTNTPFNGTLANAGLGYFSFTASASGVTLQQFSPYLYKQLVTTAEQRFNAKITNMVVPTSMRTHISDTIPTSRSINRFNPADKGDTIGTYEGDFNYTYQIDDDWIMDQTGSDNTSVLFLNPDVVQWGSLRELGPNNEVFSNADASLDQYIMEGTLIVRNPAGVAVLAAISPTGAAVTGPRPSSQVKRYLA